MKIKGVTELSGKLLQTHVTMQQLIVKDTTSNLPTAQNIGYDGGYAAPVKIFENVKLKGSNKKNKAKEINEK